MDSVLLSSHIWGKKTTLTLHWLFINSFFDEEHKAVWTATEHIKQEESFNLFLLTPFLPSKKQSGTLKAKNTTSYFPEPAGIFISETRGSS